MPCVFVCLLRVCIGCVHILCGVLLSVCVRNVHSTHVLCVLCVGLLCGGVTACKMYTVYTRVLCVCIHTPNWVKVEDHTVIWEIIFAIENIFSHCTVTIVLCTIYVLC